MTEPLTLISHHLCPYVQRAAISLLEKNVPFKRINIDLADKPDWFKAISPLGKVPVLRVGDRAIFESAVILEYLEETQTRPLHPSDPLARAQHRGWIEFGSSILDTIAGFYSANDVTGFEHKRHELAEKMTRLETWFSEPGRKNGPWFAGTGFSLVDAVYAPLFRYFDAFDRIGDLASLAGKPNVDRWRKALNERPSVQNAVAADFSERLDGFLKARNSHLASLMRREAA